MDYSKHVNTRSTPQRQRTPGRTDEVQNSEGGFVHQVDDWDRLDRFLILGSEGGTFYVGERELTRDNAEHVINLIKSDGVRVVRRVVEISNEGRAHKNDAALFVLAAALKLGDEQTRKLASGVMPQVARTGTMLFMFAKFVEAFGGWGRATKRAFQNWYKKDTEKLAVQLLKYRQRDGWSHRDILRLAHPLTDNEQIRAMFDVTCRPEKLPIIKHGQESVIDWDGVFGSLPNIYRGYCIAQSPEEQPDPYVIERYNLSWEMLPTEWLNDPKVNAVLLRKMPLMATIRQLGKLTANGTIKPLSEELELVIERLTNAEQIKRSRIHPMHYLLAAKTYEAGQGFRGSLKWKVDSKVLAALNDGFYMAFKNVEPTNKAFLLGVDVSSSMSWAHIGNSNITAAEAAGAMALVIAKTEPKHFIHGFSDQFVNLGIGPKDTLAQACRKVQRSNFGRTDCAVPMLYALQAGIHVDTFVVLTDSETWAGQVKPRDALRKYRETVNPNAKLVVVGMTSTGFTIADPNDAGMLDVVGFDANVLPVISEFTR